MMNRLLNRLTAAILAAGGLFPGNTMAQSGTWITGTAGAYNWSDVANWQGGIVADGANNTATFATAGLTGAMSVNLDSGRTIGALVFDNPTNTFGWSVTGVNTLTLSNAGGPTIAVNNASIAATIAAPLAGTQGFTKTGPGTLALTGNNTGLGGNITISSGALFVSGGGVNPLGTAALTLSGGSLVFANGGVSGFNKSMVVPVGQTFANGAFNATMDGGAAKTGYTFYELGQNTTAPATGLPMGTTFISSFSGAQYTLQPATMPNARLLDAADTVGRLVLATPTALPQLSFLTASGNGPGTVTATLHYTDGTPDATGLTFTSPDWVSGPANAAGTFGRINSAGYATGGTLYDEVITNPNPTHPIGSVDLSWAGGATTHTAVFAVNTPVLSGGALTQTYTNNLTVTADSTITAAAPTTVGNMTIGSNTLNVTGLTAGIVNLTGNPTFNGDLTIAAFQDGGTARTITKTGGGALTLVDSVASGISAGTTFVMSAGTVNVNGGNAFGPSPNVTINGGTVNLNYPNSFGTAPNVTVNTGTVNLLLSAGFQSLSGSPGPNGSGVVAVNGDYLILRAPTTVTYGGTIRDGSSAGVLEALGTGTQVLSAVNTYSGGTIVGTGSRLAATAVGALGTGLVVINSGTLSVAGAPAGTAVINNFGPTSNWALNGSATFTASNQLQLTPSGGGTGSAWFTNPLPTSPFSLKFTYTVISASNPPADGFTVAFQNAGLTALGAGGSALGYTGIAPSAGVQFNLYPPNTFGGSGSGIGLANSGSVQNPVPSTFPVNLGAINDPTNVTLSYDGQNLRVFLVQGQNAYSSPLMPLNLAATLGSNAYFGFTGATGGLMSQQQITNLQFGGPSFSTYPNELDIASGVPSTIQVAATPLAPAVTMGNATLEGGGALTVSADPGTPVDQPFGLTLRTTTLNGTAVFNVVNNGAGTGTLTLGPVLNGTNGSSALIKSGSGTLILTAAGTYTGATTINGGTLDLNNAAGFGPSPAVLINSGTLNLLAGINPTFVSLSGGGTVLLNGNALTLGSANGVYVGVIADGSPAGGSLVKVGSGKQTLSGANTYTGGTTVDFGQLIVGNTSGSATGSGMVTVLNGGTLAGGNGGGSGNPFADSTKGFIAGSVTLQSGGDLAPGAGGPGLLTVGGSVNFQSGSTWSISLGTDNPRTGISPTDVNTNGRLVTPLDILFGNSLTMPIDGGGQSFGAGQTYDYYIGRDDGVVGGLPVNITFELSHFASSVDPSEFALSRSADGQSIVLTFAPVPVPEPGSLALAGAAAFGLFSMVRRGRASQSKDWRSRPVHSSCSGGPTGLLSGGYGTGHS